MRRCTRSCLAGFSALVLATAVAAAQPPLDAGAPPPDPVAAPLAPEAPDAGDAVPPPATPAVPPPAPAGFDVQPLPNDDGRHLSLSFRRAQQTGDGAHSLVVFRRPAVESAPASAIGAVVEHRGGALRWTSELAGGEAATLDASAPIEVGAAVGPWTVVAIIDGPDSSIKDEVAAATSYEYLAVEVRRDADGTTLAVSRPLAVGPRRAEAAWFHTERWGFGFIVALIAGLIWYYVRRAKARPQDIFIRRMPGVDALEDAVGRSTEMGRPVLYVTGLEEIQDIMTIASLLILGHVAELTANYDTEIKVANYFPLTMVVAEEIVRQGYANAGRSDAHRPENVLFITAEQFAFAAGVNGIILRDKPATNIYFGKFFGESLLLAETGYTTGAIQIAGTAELPQLPFFIAACDYTLIGEELYATSAYLSREPTLLANLKAGDAFKVLAMLFIAVGAALATAGIYELAPKVFP